MIVRQHTIEIEIEKMEYKSKAFYTATVWINGMSFNRSHDSVNDAEQWCADKISNWHRQEVFTDS